MKDRRQNKRVYFDELAVTSEKYLLPYISEFMAIEPGMNVLEIGCGEGGNLLPFSKMGCRTLGVDLSEGKIKDAIRFFAEEGAEGEFIASDIFKINELKGQFDLIICHDVIEHIFDKEEFLRRMKDFIKPDGIIFMAFPAWQMPFGGHQQVCRNGFLRKLPYFHLLPAPLYRRILKAGGESPEAVKELLEIKHAGLTVERFARISGEAGLETVDRRMYLVNPHYEVKFGQKPRKLPYIIGVVPYFRDFFCTSCFHLLKPVEKTTARVTADGELF